MIQQQRIDIHDYDRKVLAAMKKINESALTEHNKNILPGYANQLRLAGIGNARIIKYLGTLRIIGLALGKDFESATKQDLERFMLGVMARRGLSAWTKRDYAVTLRKFYSWLQGDGKLPPEKVACISTTLRKRDQPRIQKSELLTESDVQELLRACRNARDRAFISMLWDSGARIGELGSMHIGDITFKDTHTLFDLCGKTGPRTILACECVRALLAWIEVHPCRDDPKAPLWVSTTGRLAKERLALTYSHLRAIVQEAFKRTSLKKRFNPHLFRHSRATWCVEHDWSSYQLCRHFGWELDSGMPATYLSLSDKLVHDKMLATYGIKNDAEAARPEPCSRCGGVLPLGRQSCAACGMPTAKSPRYRELLAEETARDKIGELLRLPEVRAALVKAAAQDHPSVDEPGIGRPDSVPLLPPPVPGRVVSIPGGAVVPPDASRVSVAVPSGVLRGKATKVVEREVA